MNFAIEFDREDDGRWTAEINELPCVIVYGTTQREAKAKVEALAFRVLAMTGDFKPTAYSASSHLQTPNG